MTATALFENEGPLVGESVKAGRESRKSLCGARFRDRQSRAPILKYFVVRMWEKVSVEPAQLGIFPDNQRET